MIKITPSQRDTLQSVLTSQQNNAASNWSSSVSNQRAALAKYYNAEKYGDEVPDRSQYVDAMIRDTIESIKPELMNIFFGGDKVVEFEPRGRDDEAGAAQETEIVNYIVSQKNSGFKVFLDWFHDALVFKNGYVKCYWDEKKTTSIEEYGDIDLDEMEAILASIQEDDDVQKIDIQEGGDEYEQWQEWAEGAEEALKIALLTKVAPDPNPPPEPFDVRMRITKHTQKYKVISIPPEEVYIHPEWTEITFEDCPFVAHRSARTISDLVADGFSRKEVENLPTYDARMSNQETQERFETEFVTETDFDTNVGKSMREVLVYENYIMHDLDDDGIAELIQVYTGENAELLKREGKYAIRQVDHVPIVANTPLPIPHKHYGLAISELVEDLQRFKTIMVRQLIDNLFIGNNADVVVDSRVADKNTYNDLTQTKIGRVIRVPGGQAAVSYMETPNTAAASLAAIEYIDTVKEARTGVTRYNQGMDADSLNKTASGMKQIMTASQQRILMIARIFAETGVKTLFVKMHGDLRKGPVKKLAMKLNDEWVDVNPRTWVHRADMTISVGLGTGNRDEQFQRLMLILAQQKEALAGDPTGEYTGVTMQNLHHTLVKIMEISGFHDTGAFFPKPKEGAKPPTPEPLMDPSKAMVEIEKGKGQIKQMEIQAKQAEAQARQQLEAARLELERVKQDADEQEARAKIDVEISTETQDGELGRDKMATEVVLNQAKMENQINIERLKLGMDVIEDGRAEELNASTMQLLGTTSDEILRISTEANERVLAMTEATNARINEIAARGNRKRRFRHENDEIVGVDYLDSEGAVADAINFTRGDDGEINGTEGV